MQVRTIGYIAFVLCIAATTSSSAMADAGPKSHAFTLRVECKKDSSRGCTASARVCTNAPEGRYFAVQSVSGAVNNAWSPGHQPQCGIAKTSGEGVAINGLLAPTSMCASLHAESGSGVPNIGKVAFVNCNYTATTYPIPE